MIKSKNNQIARINRVDFYNTTVREFSSNREGIDALNALIKEFKAPLAPFDLHIKGITWSPQGMYFWITGQNGFLVTNGDDGFSITVINDDLSTDMAIEHQLLKHSFYVVPMSERTGKWS
jgi:hypothetical protein